MTQIIIWCALVALGVVVLVAAAALLLRTTRLGERRERWHDQATGPVGAMLNALFLVSLALSVITAWQAYDHATGHVRDEAAALAGLFASLGDLPGGEQLQGEVRAYTQTVLDLEWPALATRDSERDPDQSLPRIASGVLAIRTTDGSVQAARTRVLKYLDVATEARRSRLHDATTSLPKGLLACLVLTALAALGHVLLMGLPHTAASMIPLLAEAAVIATGVFVVFATRSPYRGVLHIDPEPLRDALAAFTPNR
ncbi:DUF4239 domain-containing protein [Solihabitans fulvus]|uniref:DUF4239 domain-containing protein n=1 Tax=Solihabitans fulvus TaxID=1892852 RepID=A0A5B2XUZ7_9PSEU|nr:DUF4239 domain-containing protein [Solihabitans fulvus]KAA2267123.1 DUF4239 domain-containing protein [Solihabitans fulvus]